jgi:hypothetical protein
MLELQGVSWITRKAISLATISLGIRHFKDDDGVEHISINQTLSGGIKGTTESRVLNWTFRPHEDYIFGAVRGRSRRIKVEDIEVPYLQKDWLPDTLNHGAIQAYAESDTEKSSRVWSVLQVLYDHTKDLLRSHGRRLGRSGDLRPYREKEGMRDTSSLKGRRTRTSSSGWCMIMVRALCLLP